MALLFDNASSQRVAFTRDALLEQATNKLSMCMWVMKTGTMDSFARLAEKEYNNGNTSPYISYGFERGGSDAVYFNIGTGSGLRQAGGNSSLNDNQWTSLVGVYDGSLGSDNGVLYFNGVPQANKFSHTGNIAYHSGAGNFDIGGNSGGGNYASMRAAFVCVWFDALSASEIAAINNRVDPWVFRNDKIMFYHPLDGWESVLTEWKNRLVSTITNAPTVANGPPVGCAPIWIQSALDTSEAEPPAEGGTLNIIPEAIALRPLVGIY